MKLIVANYLLFHHSRDLTKSLIKYFYERLGIFLSLDLNNCPEVIFTSNVNLIKSYYGSNNIPSAFFNEVENVIVFYSNKWKIKSKQFRYDVNKISEELKIYNVNLFDYNYVIPLSDLYHEMIHNIQYFNGQYNYTDFLEATNEIMTYFITGQWNIEYLEESFSLWYIFKNILKYKTNQFYTFIRNCIVKKDFDKRYFLCNKDFINLLSKKYNGDIKLFFNNFTNDFFKYYNKFKNNFEKDLKYVHSLIFYKY